MPGALACLLSIPPTPTPTTTPNRDSMSGDEPGHEPNHPRFELNTRKTVLIVMGSGEEERKGGRRGKEGRKIRGKTGMREKIRERIEN